MMGSRILMLIVLAACLAASCHGLPKMTEEVVPEAQTLLLQHTAAFTKMSPTAFISAISSSGGSEADCRTFATETIKDIKQTVTSTQETVGAIDTGSSCAAMGQAEVTTATAVVTAAKTELETAKTDAATKQSAEDAACSASFEVAPLSLTGFKSGMLRAGCLDISNDARYTAADATCTSATTTSAEADQAVVAAKTKVTGTEAALATVVAEASRLMSGCLCRVHKEQTAALASASSAAASHAADWKQAHEVLCALDKTTTCTVPTCPTLTQPTLADGVANADSAHCTNAPTKSPTNAPTNPPTEFRRDDDACILRSYHGRGGGWRTCFQGYLANGCESAAKDMQRCCTHTCSNYPVLDTQKKCEASPGAGICEGYCPGAIQCNPLCRDGRSGGGTHAGYSCGPSSLPCYDRCGNPISKGFDFPFTKGRNGDPCNGRNGC